MDFLVHEINLEYEVKIMRKNYLAELEKKRAEEIKEKQRIEEQARKSERDAVRILILFIIK